MRYGAFCLPVPAVALSCQHFGLSTGLCRMCSYLVRLGKAFEKSGHRTLNFIWMYEEIISSVLLPIRHWDYFYIFSKGTTKSVQRWSHWPCKYAENLLICRESVNMPGVGWHRQIPVGSGHALLGMLALLDHQEAWNKLVNPCTAWCLPDLSFLVKHNSKQNKHTLMEVEIMFRGAEQK